MAGSHSIWIIKGSTGEFSDWTIWDVTWRMTKEEAEDIRLRCEEQAREEQAREDPHRSSYGLIDNDKFIDKHYRCDYTGMQYSVWELDDEGNSSLVSRTDHPIGER